MLVLERKEGQRIVINGNITIVISGVNSYERKVKIGINAPRDIIVDREEVHVKRMEANRAKSKTI